MKTTRFFQIGILASLAVAAAACSDSSSGSSKTTSSTGNTTAGTNSATGFGTTTGGSATGTGTSATSAGTSASGTTTGATTAGTTGGSAAGALVFNDMGWVDGTSNTLGIQGPFYAYGDGLGMTGQPPGDCQNAGFTMPGQCSTVTMTVNATGTPSICITGSAAQVINGTDGMPAYSQIWGAGLGFDLNNSGGDASVKSPYDASTHHVVGVAFDLDTFPTGGELRVEFPTPATATAAHYVTVPDAGHFEARFADAGVFYLSPPDTTAIDTTQINSFQWHIATNTKAAVPFNFCLSNITPIVE